MKKGFTLIELLVVVLIIGILSAIALPQYQTAVLKSKYANLVLLAETYVKAGQVAQLSLGEWPSEFASLDVDLPSGITRMTNPTSNNCGEFSEYYCCLLVTQAGYQSGGVTCGMKKLNLGFGISVDGSGNIASRKCLASVTDEAANRLCKGVGTYNGTGDGNNMPGPDGHVGGMNGYLY